MKKFYIFINPVEFLVSSYKEPLTFVTYSDFLIIDSTDLARKQYCTIIITNENPYL
jgi:hypothetical protein